MIFHKKPTHSNPDSVKFQNLIVMHGYNYKTSSEKQDDETVITTYHLYWGEHWRYKRCNSPDRLLEIRSSTPSSTFSQNQKDFSNLLQKQSQVQYEEMSSSRDAKIRGRGAVPLQYLACRHIC